MSTINKIKIENDIYDIEDIQARNNLSKIFVEDEIKKEEVYQASGTLISENWHSSGTGGYYDANGKWTPNDSYRWFRIDKKDTSYQLYTEGVTGVCFLHVFSGEPSENTFVARYRSNDSNLPTKTNPLTIEKDNIVIIQNTSSSGVKVICNSTNSEKVPAEFLTQAFAPNVEKGQQNIAWFGDSISQLQLLPHRVAEYINATINDCSFAGSPLTYGAEAYQGTGFMSLANQIVSGDFTELENALSKQSSVSEDKRGNADRLKALDFSTITDIVVMAGTNDVNNDYVTTSNDLTKFKNGMRTAIDTIQTAYPQINLYFVSNPYRGDVITDKHGNSLSDFINAEKEVCEEKNIPFYDLYHNSGINETTVDYYLLDDKLHQNEKGDILLSKKIAKWLMCGISTSGGNVDLTGYATEEYVDNAIANIDIPSGNTETVQVLTTTEEVSSIITSLMNLGTSGQADIIIYVPSKVREEDKKFAMWVYGTKIVSLNLISNSSNYSLTHFNVVRRGTYSFVTYKTRDAGLASTSAFTTIVPKADNSFKIVSEGTINKLPVGTKVYINYKFYNEEDKIK